MHACTHTHGANDNLPPASQAGDKNRQTYKQDEHTKTLTPGGVKDIG